MSTSKNNRRKALNRSIQAADQYPPSTEVVPQRIMQKLPQREQQQLIAIFEQHSGPIPSAKAMQRYEEVLPGSANRIIAMAENEQKIREEYTKIMAPADVVQSKMAQHYAFVFLMTLSVGGIWLTIIKYQYIGGGCLAVACLAVLGNYFKRGSH